MALTLSWQVGLCRLGERMYGGIVRGKSCLGANCLAKFPRNAATEYGGNTRIPLQDYKSPRAAVLICITLVNTQTHTHAQTQTHRHLSDYAISWARLSYLLFRSWSHCHTQHVNSFITRTGADVKSCVVGRDNSPILSRHPARQQPLDPTLSPPCRNLERRADWPAARPTPSVGCNLGDGGDGVAAVRVKGRR